MKPYRTVDIKKLDGASVTDSTENLAVESVLEIRTGKELLASLVCSPGLEEELTLGYLLSTGAVNSASSVLDAKLINRMCTVDLEPGEGARLDRNLSEILRSIPTEYPTTETADEIRAGRPVPSIQREVIVSLELLVAAQTLLFENQKLFRKTHGTHAALIEQVDGKDYSVAEDIGRHNAIDKAIGVAVRKGQDLSSSFLLFTGRLTADVVSKCAYASIPLVASFSAGTDAGVTFAKKTNITMIGMFRGSRARIYSIGAATIRF